MTVDPVKFGEVDLTSCDREPIHIPGAIQPHGVLLVFDGHDLTILQYAGDTASMLGVATDRILGLSLLDLFFEYDLMAITGRIKEPVSVMAPWIVLGLSLKKGKHSVDATIHAYERFGIIELETSEPDTCATGDPISQLKAMTSMLTTASSMDELCAVAASQVRSATGFDRVMIYQFMPDGCGKIVAEDKVDGLESYLGMHYPASDIPKQARALFRSSPLRLIPDVNYSPAPLFPSTLSSFGEELDMSRCTLRSVSPIHLEYLRNMGVTASMAISLSQGGALWGLIVLHHYVRRFVPSNIRVLCEAYAQILSLDIYGRAQAEAALREINSAKALVELTNGFIPGSDLGAYLTNTAGVFDTMIFGSGGVVWLDGALHTVGKTPPSDFVAQLVTWLQARGQSVFAASQLGIDYPPASAYAAVASGLLAVSLSGDHRSYAMWFRPELTQIRNWAGNPEKPVEVGPNGDRLTPRKSFELWQVEARLHSAPWDKQDLQAAHDLRLWVMEAVYRQQDLKSRLGYIEDILRASSEVGIVATDENGVITLFNSGAENILGYSADEVVNKVKPVVFHPPEYISDLKSSLPAEHVQPELNFEVLVAEAIRNGAATGTCPLVRKGGTLISGTISVTPIRGDSQEITGFLGVVLDTTERDRAKSELLEARALLSEIVSGSPIAKYVIDKNHLVTPRLVMLTHKAA